MKYPAMKENLMKSTSNANITTTLAVAGGDGIGPSVIAQALKVLDVFNKAGRTSVVVQDVLVGGAALSATGTALPEATVRVCEAADGVLLGAVGDPNRDGASAKQNPTMALLELRRALGGHTNVRPVRIAEELWELSPLARDASSELVDLVIVREMAGGLLYGEPRGRRKRPGSDEEEAFDTMRFFSSGIRVTAAVAWQLAAQRRGLVTSVDQANVLESSRLWRETMRHVAAHDDRVHLEDMLVDNCANALVVRPERFDVIVTEGVFGGILSDLAGGLSGSIGMLGSATLGSGPGLFEPVHGSAPRHAGQDRVNPVGAIRSLGLFFSFALGRGDLAEIIERAVVLTLKGGGRTYDIARGDSPVIGTEEMGDRIASQVAELLNGEPAIAAGKLAC
jgi:3-isopropylmalate dehydrogenase